MTQAVPTREIVNFGGNVRFTPRTYYEPSSEAEVLEILNQSAGRRIRVFGRLHSWSHAALANDVAISSRRLDEFRLIDEDGPGSHVWVGAGVQVKQLIAKLKPLGRTLPSLGLITEQTVVGAVSTGTHGSGRQCLSHFAEAIRIAHYDGTSGQAVVKEIHDGDALRAAQCNLGNMGVILSVKMRCRELYNVEELWHKYDELNDVLDQEKEYPLQQFFLIPWYWRYIAQHRRATDRGSAGPEWLYRIYFFLAIDIALHGFFWTLARIRRNRWLIQSLFKSFLPRSVVTNWRVIGDSSRMLIMEQELFQHVETEVFVQRSQLAAALDFVRDSLKWAAGDSDLSPEYRALVSQSRCEGEFQTLRGTYCHHFPICVRRVLPDSTLVSMTSGGTEDWYSISLITYQPERLRSGFFSAMGFIAPAMARLFDARPHWGKHNPLQSDELVALYPNFSEFRRQCDYQDPQGVFRNAWFEQLFNAVRHEHREE